MSEKVVSVYFKGKGKGYTDETLLLAKERACKLSIRNIVVASSTGYTGVKASEIFQGYNLVVVSSMVGFREPNQDRFEPNYRKIIEDRGALIVRQLHSFGTLGRAVRNKFGTLMFDEIIAHVLRRFSQGVKVCCEIACMAADTGAIRTDEECIAIGGSGGGADTAIVLKPANTHRFFDMEIKEILCKPREP
jgi:hypothetical protein